MTLHTITITDDEMDALCEAVSPMSPSGYTARLRGLLARLVQRSGLAPESRKLILDTVEATGRVEFYSPDWRITIQPCGMEDAGGFREPGWSGTGNLEAGEMRRVRNVRAATPAEVLDLILAQMAPGLGRSS